MHQPEHVGGGTVQLAYRVVAAVRNRRFCVIPEDFAPLLAPIHVVYPSARVPSAKVRAFAELLPTRPKSGGWRFIDL